MVVIGIILMLICVLFFPSTTAQVLTIKNTNYSNNKIPNLISNNEELDQNQEESDGEDKIYGEYWYAQSFKPTKDTLTKIELYIGKYTKSRTRNIIDSLISRMIKKFGELKIGKRFVNFLTKSQETPISISRLGDLKLSIRKYLDGPDLDICTIKKENVNNEKGWISFDISNINLEIFETYYIICRCDGEGNENNYYNWGFSGNDTYKKGSGLISTDSGSSWSDFLNKDFAFRTYGFNKVNYWAILVGLNNYSGSMSGYFNVADTRDFKNTLIYHGWEEDHIFILNNEDATRDGIINSIIALDDLEDEDDVVLYFHSGHAGGDSQGMRAYDQRIMADDLDDAFDNLESENIAIFLNSCWTGGTIQHLNKPGRVCLAACEADGYAYQVSFLENCVFGYFIFDNDGIWQSGPGPETVHGAFNRPSCDLNNDGWISAEEAFNHTSYWTSVYVYNLDLWPDNPNKHLEQRPQMIDEYDGELKLVKL
jgi:hypothetical protein